MTTTQGRRPPARTVTTTAAQEAGLDRFELVYDFHDPFYRLGSAGSVIAVYLSGPDDDYSLYEARVDEQGEATELNMLQNDYSGGPIWQNVVLEEVNTKTGVSNRPEPRGAIPTIIQSTTLTALTSNPDFHTSIRTRPDGRTDILSVSADGQRMVRGMVDAAGALVTAAEYLVVDDEYDWVDVKPAARKRMSKTGIPAKLNVRRR